VNELLRHPLFLLIAGAIFTGLITPTITRSYQKRQKVLEIKIGLVSELSKLIMELIKSIQFVHSKETSFSEDALAKAYLKWEVESAVIGTRLQAYFHETKIPNEWSLFSEIIYYFYTFTLDGHSKNEVKNNLLVIREKLSELSTVDYQAISNWDEIKEAILKEKAGLIQRVLNSKISL
jgi:hypothetical protein